MQIADQLVVFHLDEQRYALHLACVERAVAAVEVTPLPDAPGTVAGIVNVQGSVVPVFDLRRRFGLPERVPALSERLIVARTSTRRVALIADAVAGVLGCPEEDRIAIGEILPGGRHIEGVVKLADGLVLIHDLDRFLTLDEERALEGALQSTC